MRLQLLATFRQWFAAPVWGIIGAAPGSRTLVVALALAAPALGQTDCADGLVYDDGTFENAYGGVPQWSNAEFVMRFDPPPGTHRVDEICVCFTRTGADTQIAFDLNVDSAPGPSGLLLGQLVQQTASAIPHFPQTGFYSYDLAALAIEVDGPVFIGPAWDPTLEPDIFLCADQNGSPSQPGFWSNDIADRPPSRPLGQPDNFPAYRNLGVRAELALTAPPDSCVPSATTLCVDDEPGDRRFLARVDFDTSQGAMPSGPGTVVPLSSLGIPSGGVFWFTNPQNPEMLLKVLDGCAFNDHYWVFYAAGTNFALRTEVIDTQTGRAWESVNPDRRPAPPVGDIFAFPCEDPADGQSLTAAAPERAPRAAAESRAPEIMHLAPREACSSDATTLCIDDQPGDRRFEATVFFATTQGGQPMGFGSAIPLTTVGIPYGGIFWFTSPQNPEMLLKVLNGCSFNDHFWVFYAAGTNFGLEVEVVDTKTGTTWRSVNEDRRQAPPVGDIKAFPCEAP